MKRIPIKRALKHFELRTYINTVLCCKRMVLRLKLTIYTYTLNVYANTIWLNRKYLENM